MAANRAFLNGSIILLLAVVVAGDMSNSEKSTINGGIAGGVKIAESIAKFGDPKTSKMFNTLGKMSSFLGAAGGFVSLIFAFLPTGDSRELKYMKRQFTLVNTKLDKITTELDNIKGLIKFENQKAAYLSSAHAILHGHRQMLRLFNELQRTRCSRATCPRVRARIGQRYIASLNVKRHLEKILHGTVKSTSVFGDPLLDLVKKTFHCDFSKINQFTNGILKLAFKAQQVVLAHEKLTGSKHSILQSMNDWLKNVYNLRDKSFAVKQSCFDSIRTQMTADIGNSDYQIRSSTNAIANSKVKKFLEAKYPWIRAVPFSYSAYGSDQHCVTNTYGKFWNMPSDRNARKRVLVVGLADKTGTYNRQKYKVINALRSIAKNTDFYRERKDCCKILSKIKEELKGKNMWQYIVTLNVRKSGAGFEMVERNALTVINRRIWLHYYFNRRKDRRSRRTFSVYITMVLKSMEQAGRRHCILPCQNKGQCKQYPYSSTQYCQCKPFYQGEKCQEHSDVALAKTVDVMVAETLKLPVLSDVYFEIKDLRRYLGISLNNVQKGISNLEATIQRKFDELSKITAKNFKWANLVTQYSKYTQRISYFAHLFERLPLDYKDKKIQQRMGKHYSIDVLRVTSGIMRPLYHLHDLLSGLYHGPFQHKSILLIFMENKAGVPCTSSYKRAVDNYWRKLALLQQLGYMVWAQALDFDGKKTDIVHQTYKRRLAKQLNVIKTKTCDYTIPNSRTVRCVGHYLQPSMTITNRCKYGYYVTGSKTSSCKRKTTHCKRCQCYGPGSVNMQCSDLNGKCRCRKSFYGQNCNNRDCVWSSWSRYGKCLRCGYGAKKRRRRYIKVRRLGNGKKCQGSRYSYAKCFKGCCRNQFHCSRRRNCIRSSYKCDYDNDCGDHQDEHGCSERCFYRYTRLSSYGGGRVVYLDRYRPQCPWKSALKYFRLQRIGNRVRYRYICCRFTRDICRNRRRYSGFTYAVHNSNAKRLTRQSVNCPGSAYISGFGLQRNRGHNRIRYSYNCCFLRYKKHKRRSSCYIRHTRWTYDGKGNVVYLDRQYVGCRHRYFLSYFRLQHKRSGSWWRKKGYFRYRYRCCKINS